jgi:hypothetical protein
MTKAIGIRLGVLAAVLSLAPGSTALATGTNDDKQVVCWQGGTYTVERAAVPLILIYGGHLGACPASPSR